MKKLLVLLSFLLLPLTLSAGELEERFWFCRQNGNVGENLTMAITDVWADNYPNHYDEREQAFERHVLEITEGAFQPSFQAKCREYHVRADAEKHRKVEIKTAQRYNANVLELEWRWTPDVGEGKRRDAEGP